MVFSLDNEPDLWSSTHAEVHPSPVTYTELANRNIDYATAIKRVWPTAKVTGPVNYGFYGFENAAGRARRRRQGRLPRLVPRPDEGGRHHGRACASSTTSTCTGTPRPPAAACASPAPTPAPRSWRPASRRPARCGTRPTSRRSWITTDYGYGAIRLIPRTKDRIAAHYPGTGIAFTEWNYGGGGHISGAIACADVLGIFGREGVDLATYWPLQSDESYAYGAFARLPQLRRRRRPLRRHLGAGHHERHDQLERVRRHRRGQPQPGGHRGHQQGHHGQDDVGEDHRRADLRPRQDLHADRRLADAAGRGRR